MAFTIYDSLPLGKENAVSAEELAKIHGIKDTRSLRHEVTAERLNGAYIAGCERGYSGLLPCANFRSVGSGSIQGQLVHSRFQNFSGMLSKISSKGSSHYLTCKRMKQLSVFS